MVAQTSCQYWQGMNFIGGFILLVYGGDEEKAFWMMRCMLDSVLVGVYGAAGPRIELDLLDGILRERLPLTCKKIKSLGIPLQTYTLPWLMCMFTTGTPAETTLQIWDLMLLGSAPHRAGSNTTNAASSRKHRAESRDANVDNMGGSTTSDDGSNGAGADGDEVSPEPPSGFFVVEELPAALTQNECAMNIVLLLILGMFTLLEKVIEQANDPSSLDVGIKQSVRRHYDCKALLAAAVDAAGQDKQSWSSQWSWHELLAPIRLRLSRTQLLHGATPPPPPTPLATNIS
jgi:hypothetical protein